MKEPKRRKSAVHPNVIGKREMQWIKDTMIKCVENPMPKVEVDRLHKLYKTGPYSESYDPVKLKAALQSMEDNHSHQYRMAKQKKPFGSGTGTGKKQLEAERQKLILELENG